MGLKLTAKCLPRYFERLKEFGEDYCQFDEITFINTETGEEKTFTIEEIRFAENPETVRNLTPDIHWRDEEKIYVIELGTELRKKKGGKKCSAKKN